MVDECYSIESNRCSIIYSTPIIQVQLTTKNNTIHKFHSIFISTTATAAQLIDFDQRNQFINKYRSLRQLHYDCSTKILLFFNVSWWIKQENITNGRSITDLPIRFIYYPNINQTNDGTILASYTWSYEIHRFSPNIREYFQGGKVKHWCNDPYSHGSFACFTPFQEVELTD